MHEIGYAFAEVIDFATLDADIIHSDEAGEISGVSLINGEPAEIVDPHWLFSHHVGSAQRVKEQLVCYLPADDPWIQNMLRPMIEAAGYQVVGDDHSGDKDLVIASRGSDVPDSSAKNVIWLRADPDPQGKKDESIYRYDRAGLLMALKSVDGRGR